MTHCFVQENRLAEDETRMVISESDSQEEHSEENQDLGLIKFFYENLWSLSHRVQSGRSIEIKLYNPND